MMNGTSVTSCSQGSGLRLAVDVKTRTEEFHIRTLELVEQTISHPKELYVSARLYRERNAVRLLGWFTREDLLTQGKIENQGYLDNYVMYDRAAAPDGIAGPALPPVLPVIKQIRQKRPSGKDGLFLFPGKGRKIVGDENLLGVAGSVLGMVAAVGIVLLQMQHMVPLAPADQFLIGHALVDKYIGEGKADLSPGPVRPADPAAAGPPAESSL